MKLAAAAESLGVTDANLRLAIRRGAIQGYKLDGDWHITAAEVNRYRIENKGKSGRPPGPKRHSA